MAEECNAPGVLKEVGTGNIALPDNYIFIMNSWMVSPDAIGVAIVLIHPVHLICLYGATGWWSSRRDSHD